MLVLKVIILTLLQITIVKCGVVHSDSDSDSEVSTIFSLETTTTFPYRFDLDDTAETTTTTTIVKPEDGASSRKLLVNRAAKAYSENPHEKIHLPVKKNPQSTRHEKRDEKKESQHPNSISNGVKDDLAHWQAPRYIQENFPYYIAGYDEEKRPIFIVEMGHMDLRRLITEQGEEVRATFFKYLNQTAFRLLQSMKNQSTDDFPVTDLVVIVDFDGFHARQLTSLPNLQLLLKIVATFSDFLARHLHSVYIINATYLAEQLINLTRPVFGGTFSRFEVYGTSKKSWMPVIRRIAGENQLPSWYGGSSQFKPVAVFGR